VLVKGVGRNGSCIVVAWPLKVGKVGKVGGGVVGAVGVFLPALFFRVGGVCPVLNMLVLMSRGAWVEVVVVGVRG
jgi:hypothetical protein